MKKILFILTALITTGCVSTVKMEEGLVKSMPVYMPDLNKVSTVSLGERMMHEAYGWDVSCITPTVTKNKTSFGFKQEIKAYKKLCGNSLGTNMYLSDYHIITQVGSNVGIGVKEGYIVETQKKDGTLNLCVGGLSTNCHAFQNNEIIRETKFKMAMNSLQQSIEYMGRDGDIMKFLYTEFKDDMARSAFNREFIVDLTKGSTLNFKGAEVEIINATNTTINYKVIKYFN